MSDVSDYAKFRGKCKELAEDAIRNDPTLRLVRGHYYCPIWGKQAHWWAARPNGEIVDPTARQFPSGGIGEYVEWDNTYECEQCGRAIVDINTASVDGHHIFCSGTCHAHCVGIF